jgi:hypothetical protein
MKTSKQWFVKAMFGMVILLSAGVAGMGQQSPAAVFTGSGDKVRYAGTEDNMLLFDVQPESFPEAGKLQILDHAGIVVFEEKIPAGTAVRRYKIPSDEIDISTVTFRLSGKGFSFSQSFSVNYRVEERVEIKKVN